MIDVIQLDQRWLSKNGKSQPEEVTTRQLEARAFQVRQIRTPRGVERTTKSRSSAGLSSQVDAGVIKLALFANLFL